jgi:hypothetical protein
MLFTSESCHFDLAHGFAHPFCYTEPETVISDRVDDQFDLEVLSPMDDVDLPLKIEKVLLHPEHSMMLL